MELPQDIATAARDNLKGEGNDRGPYELIAAMTAMVDPRKVKHSLAQAQGDESVTDWAGLWLTNNHVAYCRMRAVVRDWSLTSHREGGHGHAANIGDAWVAPLSAIRGLGVRTVETWVEEQTRRADLTWTLLVDGHDPVPLPLWGAPHRSRRVEVEAMVDALRGVLGIDDVQTEQPPHVSGSY